MPEELLIEQLEEAISNYKLIKNEDGKRKVIMYMQLLSTKTLTENDSIESVINSVNEVKKLRDILNKPAN